MKIIPRRTSYRRFVVLVALTPLASWAAETTPASHVLFTGTDIQIEHQGSLHPVVGLEKGGFIIQANNQRVVVPMGANPERLKVSKIQLLSERSATITNFKFDRSYSPASDPVRKWSNAMAATADMHAAAEHAEKVVGWTPKTLTVTDHSVITPMGFGTKQVDNPRYPIAVGDAVQAASRVGGNMGTAETYAERIAEEQAQELYDALDVEFQISSATPIAHPYVVVTAKIREKDDPQYVRSWLFTKTIDPIDAAPRKVMLREAGFPRGFIVEKLQVHLYENGVEIATDLSENQARLTREEAHEYLVIDYTSTHPDATQPPQLALANLPEDWKAHRHDEAFRKAYYVKVDAEGRSAGVFEDSACAKKAPESYCVEVLNRLLFLPALKKGKPVEGVLRIIPSSVSI